MGRCGRGVAAGVRQGAAGFAGTSAASRRHTVADAERLRSRMHSHDGPRAVGGAHGGSCDPSAHKRHGCWAPARTRAVSFPIMQCYAKKPALLASAGWCSRPSGLLYTLRIGRRTLHNIYVIGPETRAPALATAPRRRENEGRPAWLCGLLRRAGSFRSGSVCVRQACEERAVRRRSCTVNPDL